VGLLDGELASLVADALVGAELTKPATLIKIVAGERAPGAISAGTHPTTQAYQARAIEASLTALKLAGTLIDGVDAAIRLFGATIGGGQVPAAGDRIAIGGRTYTIVDKGVSRDPAGVAYLCQCRA
jgi:hypothetical protein